MSNELSDALHEIRDLQERLKQLEHRYKESEVWLACFTSLLSSSLRTISCNEIARSVDIAAKQYWERFP